MRPASPLLAMLGLLCLAGAGLSAPGRPAPAVRAPEPGWPAFKGSPQRLGVGPALDLPVTERWRVRLKGSLYSSPAIAQGLVVLGSSNRRVQALDLDSGAERWSRELPDRIWGSAPAVDAGRVYIGCVDGCVHALALADGDTLGSYCAQRKGFFGERPDVLSSPLVVHNRLFFGSDNHDIYGWDLSGRREQWRHETGDILHDNAAAWGDGVVYMPSRDGKLYALGEEDGALRWAFQAPKPFNTTPAVGGGSVYVGNADGALYCLNAADGAPRWSFPTRRGVMSSPALGPDGSLVFGSADGHVYCLDAATGAERWRFKTGDLVLASPLLTGGLVWIGGYDDQFYALGLADGAERWRTQLKGGIFTSAAASGDRIVVAGRDGEVLCLQASAPR